MKKEYDFSKGVRGKFYKGNAKFNLPVYLDSEAYNFIEKIAKEKKKDISAVVSEFIKEDMKLVEIVK